MNYNYLKSLITLTCLSLFLINNVNSQSVSTLHPNVYLSVTDGMNTRNAQVFFLESSTFGFDNGYDSTRGPGTSPSGESFNLGIYTKLVTDNRTGDKFDEDYSIQTVPNESAIIAIGFDGSSGEEVTFSAIHYGLTANILVYLEDRENNIFTDLSNSGSNYKVTLTSNLSGEGRFYLHTVEELTLAINDNIEASRNKIVVQPNPTRDFINILGLARMVNYTIYSFLGKKIKEGAVIGDERIDVENFDSGIYLLELEEGNIFKFIKE